MLNSHFNQASDLIDTLISRYKSQVDFLAIRLERKEGTYISLQGGKVENLSTGISVGGQVRAYHRGGWGLSSFNKLDTLELRIQEAIAAAKWVGTDENNLAPAPIIRDRKSVVVPIQATLSQKRDLCFHYDDILRSQSDRIVSNSVSYGDSTQEVIIATSEGTLIEQAWSDLEMRFGATARKGDVVQTARETVGSRLAFSDIEGLDVQVKSAASRAVTALDLTEVKGDTYTVVIDPILAGLFVHEAFGHLSEADTIYENPDLLEVMTLGRQFGTKDLQIFDGASTLGHRGSYLYDDEGVPATTTQLIQDGVLVGRLHSRETAGKLGEMPTGNARCLDYHYAPIVRMTNTWIARGTTTVADLFSDIPVGIYAKNWQGGMTNGEMFTFTAGEAWTIRDGKIDRPVKDVTLSGNVFQTLGDIEAIADDFFWDESGGCGKGGQNGLAVGCGSPSLRIKNVVVGGVVD